MGKQYTTGIIITGDPRGGVRAMQITDKELEKLNKTQEKGRKVQQASRKEIDKSSVSAKDYAGKLGLVTTKVSALATAISSLGIVVLTKETVAATREATAWANAVGVSTQELQAAEYATQSLGLAQGKIGDIYKDTAEKIADAYLNNGGEAAEALQHINLSAAELVNLAPDQQLLAIAGGLDAVGSNAAKVQILESLASDASLLLPLLDNDAEKLKQLKQEAIDSGLALSAFDTAKLNVLDAQFRELSATSSGLGNQITLALSPAVYGITEALGDLIDSWGGMGNVANTVVDGIVSGVGFVLDVNQEFRTVLKLIEIGLLNVGKLGVDAFVGIGQSGVDLLNTVLQPIRELIGRVVEGYGYIIQIAADVSGKESWRQAAEFALGYADAIKESKFEMEDFTELQQDMQEQLAESNAELEALVNAGAPSDELKKWLEDQRKELERLAQANIDAADAQREHSRAQGELYQSTKETTQGVAQIYEDTATSIRNSFRGAFRDLLDDQNTFADRMVSIFKDMLADMATLAIARPVIIPIVSGLGSVLGVSGTAQASVINQLGGAGVGGFNLGNLTAVGGLLGSYGGIGGQQGAMLAAQTAEFGSAGSALTAQAAGTSFWSTAGTALGSGFVGYLAGGAAAQIFNVANPGMTSALTGIGAVIGGPVGGAVGFALGGLFGGDWQTKSSGLELSLAGGVFSGRSFQDQTKKGGWFSSDSNRTIFSALDTELSRNLRDTFDTIISDFSDMGDTLGRNAEAVLADFSTNARLSLQGLSETEISEKINQWIQDVSNEMALQILPGLITFQRAGEEAAATLARLTLTLESINSIEQSIADSISLLTADSADLVAQMLVFREAGEAIQNTLLSIADTGDITERVALEQQLYNQVLDRYRLEQAMLQDMQNLVADISSNISSLRESIAGDVFSITGAANYRDINAIRGDFNALLPADAPVYTPVDLSGINAQVDEALRNIVEKQNLLADYNGKLNDILSDQGFVDFLDNIARSGQTEAERLAHLQEVASQYAHLSDQALEYMGALGTKLSLESYIEVVTGALEELQNSYQALLNDRSYLEQQAAEALTAYNAALGEYVGLTSDQVAQLQGLRDETLRYYNAQKLLDNAMTTAAGTLGATLDRLRLAELAPGTRLDEQLAGFRGLVASAANVTGYDLVDITSQLNTMVDPILAQARDLFASGAGYQSIFSEITGALTGLEERLLTEAPSGYEQDSLGLLTSIDGLLATMQGELSNAEQAIVNAIELSRADTVGTLEDIRQLLGGEGRTIDGSHAAGLARVPFDGYTAELHKDEAVFDAGFMADLRRYGIPVNSAESNSISRLIPAMERIVRAVEQVGGDLHVRVTTPDGKLLKEETINDIRKRSKRGEIVVYAGGVSA